MILQNNNHYDVSCTELVRSKLSIIYQYSTSCQYHSLYYYVMILNEQHYTDVLLLAYSELVLLNNCICAGHEVIYQCTVCGQGATEWTGSLFDCAGNTITLRHNQFWSGIGGECNNGAVIARRIGTTIINCSLCFISQLSFSASYDKNNKTILCLYVDGTSENIVDTTTMVITTGIHMHNIIMPCLLLNL